MSRRRSSGRRQLPPTPRRVSNAERPPWSQPNGGENTIHGSEIAPEVGRIERHKQNQKHFSDRHLLQSLRVHDDPNTEWRREKIQQKLAEEDDNLPSVFQRLTDPKRYSGTHRHRFDAAGKGRGIEGRRDDTEYNVNVTGKGTIIRDVDPEMDTPSKPRLSWDYNKLRPDAYYTSDMTRLHSVDEAFTDPEMTHGVYGKLAQEKMPVYERDGGEYEDVQRTRQSFGINRDSVKAWQAGL
eukprot:m.78599 g.78599  ORF g.78599 m.78599 type:complete len:239 (+) comp16246_c0_seq3:278-994(+)